MYKRKLYKQFTLADFNQPIGLKMNSENRWVKKADKIPWDEIEEKYASLFESTTGTVAKPLHMALGSLFDYPDRIQLFRQGTCSADPGESILPVFHRTPRISTGAAICSIIARRVS